MSGARYGCGTQYQVEDVEIITNPQALNFKGAVTGQESPKGVLELTFAGGGNGASSDPAIYTMTATSTSGNTVELLTSGGARISMSNNTTYGIIGDLVLRRTDFVDMHFICQIEALATRDMSIPDVQVGYGIEPVRNIGMTENQVSTIVRNIKITPDITYGTVNITFAGLVGCVFNAKLRLTVIDLSGGVYLGES